MNETHRSGCRIARRALLVAAGVSTAVGALPSVLRAGLLSSPVRMRLVAAGTFAPFAMSDGQGGVMGICADVLAALSERLGWEIEYNAVPWVRAQAMVETGEADAFVAIPTAARSEYALFARKPMVETDLGFLAFNPESPRRPEIEAADSMDALRSFLVVEYQGNGWAENHWNGFDTVLWVRDIPTIVRMIANGRADVAVQPREVMAFHARQLGLVPSIAYRRAEFVPDRIIGFHFGLRRSFPDAENLVTAFEAAQAAFIAEGGLQAVLERYG